MLSQGEIERRNGIRLYRLGKHHSIETRAKISASLKGRFLLEETKIKLSLARLGTVLSEETKAKIGANVSVALMGHHISKDTRRKIGKSVSRAIKLLWQNEGYVRKTLAGWQQRPTKPESYITELLNIHFPKDNWLYTGNGQLFVNGACPNFGGKIPDWWSDSKSCVIEFYGNFYHKPEDANRRINHFNKLGYGCIVIWEEELENEEALLKHIKDCSIYTPVKHTGITIYNYSPSGVNSKGGRYER